VLNPSFFLIFSTKIGEKMATTPLSQCASPQDVAGALRTLKHTRLENAIFSRNSREIEASLTLHVTSPPTFPAEIYVQEGSYYPALRYPMSLGEFEKVHEALETLNVYPQLLTPEIRLCRAACMHQLGKREECITFLKQHEGVFDNAETLEKMITTSRLKEKDAYEALLVLVKQLGDKQ
jgi:hypothetical protein